ncbi:MAG: mechanosensitive ion channel family protein [Deltaproteobacteria bacterium]|nr:mechanosensitive ion channel family protein [Deltaproteobacteria bacterium]
MTIRDWFPLVTTHPALAAALQGLGILLAVGLRLALRRTRIGTRLDSSLTLIAVGLLCGALSAVGRGGQDGAVFLYAYAVFVAAVLIGGVRIALVLFVDFYLRQRQGAGVSAIFRDVGSIVTYFLIILLVLRFALDINVASLIATSAVLTAIVGLALQDLLGAVISGLVLELEAPFSRDDWVRVGTFEGQVLETGWRTTKIRTRVNEVIILPNTYLSREPVTNYTRPDPHYGDTLIFEAGYEVPPHTVKQAVMAVLEAEPAVLREPVPEVRTAHFKESGVEYAVRYWLVQFGELDRIRDRLMTNLWYALRRAGVRIPYPARDLFVHGEPPAALAGDTIAATLARVPLLAPLAEEDMRTLAARARRLTFGRAEVIVREGEAGDSFYVIDTGRVAVVLGRREDGGGRTIARLAAGDCFGEMSLLAGEPRSATVVAEEDVTVLEVGRDAFHEIVVAHPDVLEPISQLATHRLEAQREHRRPDEALPAFANDVAAQRLLQRIKSFFRI